MTTLVLLPPEVLHSVLKAVEPEDLASLMLCCRKLYDYIHDNRQLFKELFLQRLDAPAHREHNDQVDWENDLKRVVKLQKILAGGQIDEKRRNFTFLAQTMADILKNATPGKTSANISLLTNLLEDEQNRDLLLCSSSIFQRARGNAGRFSPAERQLSAKLHCLYGVPIEATGRTRSSRSYPYACSKVYDLRNYTEGSFWGPYMNDGSHDVDWEKMEAVMVVLGHNLRSFSKRVANEITESLWLEPLADAVPDSYRSASIPHVGGIAPPLGVQDPFNVTGTWIRVVCFLDFTELFAYNFAMDQPPDGEPRPPLDTVEAIRIISTELYILRFEAPGLDDHPSLPVVHFDGTARSLHESWDPNADHAVRGSVRMTREGEIRWTTVSVFEGRPRWQAEGIQVGGIGSARGILGQWFDKDHNVHGPIGPTVFWKISDEIDADPEDQPGTDLL